MTLDIGKATDVLAGYARLLEAIAEVDDDQWREATLGEGSHGTALCHCGEPVVYGYDGHPNHHRGMCGHCDPVRCDAYPGDCELRPDASHALPYVETLSTIFVDPANPAAGTLAEFPDGAWIVDLPPGPIERQVLLALAHIIIDLLEPAR